MAAGSGSRPTASASRCSCWTSCCAKLRRRASELAVRQASAPSMKPCSTEKAPPLLPPLPLLLGWGPAPAAAPGGASWGAAAEPAAVAGVAEGGGLKAGVVMRAPRRARTADSGWRPSSVSASCRPQEHSWSFYFRCKLNAWQ